MSHFSPSGKLLASAENRGKKRLALWHVPDGKLVRTLDTTDEAASGVVFLGADDRLASCGEKSVQIWDASQGRILQVVRQPDEVRCLAFAPKRNLLAWARDDGIVTLWNADKGAENARPAL